MSHYVGQCHSHQHVATRADAYALGQTNGAKVTVVGREAYVDEDPIEPQLVKAENGCCGFNENKAALQMQGDSDRSTLAG